MAPSRGKATDRGKAKSHAPASQGTTSRLSSRLRARQSNNEVPEVYQDLLAEVQSSSHDEDTAVDRPLKRRRVASGKIKLQQNQRSPSIEPAQETSEPEIDDHSHSHSLQMIEQSSEYDSDEDDLDFEDVNIEVPNTSANNADKDGDGIADVSVALDPETTPKRRALPRRAPTSRIEKAHRLLVHKSHIVCLLGNCAYVNTRCNNLVLQQRLRSLLPDRIIRFLKGRENDSQFGRNNSFMDGLRQAAEVFRNHFTVNATGMRKARWNMDDDEPEMTNEAGPMDSTDFSEAGMKLEGSQDTGNQLFCAMLRSVDVDARVVCSLQTLPLVNIGAQQRTPVKNTPPSAYRMQPTTPTPASSSRENAPKPAQGVRRRLGRPGFASNTTIASPVKDKKPPFRSLAYPVWWVEAFNSAVQEWIAVDPIVTETFNKPDKIEPPGSYALNQLTYAIAFESSGVAKDVTRRYTKAYNAKTRRQRVESTENGAEWLKKALDPFRRRGPRLDREQVEDAHLVRREAREGMPSNVQDFRGHPIYALERHLRRHEVLHPRHEAGRINTGTNANPRMEPVFRRQNVLACRSAQKWFLLGREVMKGEQPLKRIPARGKRDPEDDEDSVPTTTALYSHAQTQLHVPKPVVNRRVPRNAFGNIDVYVPSMIPAGGAHIRGEFAQRAAETLRIDWVSAITGFSFKGRQGTPIVDGVVIAAEYAESIYAIIEGLGKIRAEDASAARSLVALRIWRRFTKSLLITERIHSYGDGALAAEARRMDVAAAKAARKEAEKGGGFVPDPTDDEDDDPLLTAGRYNIENLEHMIKTGKKAAKRQKRAETPSEDEYDEDEDDAANSEVGSQESGGFERDDNSQDEDEDSKLAPNNLDLEDGGGGFIVDENTMDDAPGSGGFIPDEQERKAEETNGEAFQTMTTATDSDDAGGFFTEDAPEGIDTVVDDPMDITPVEAPRPLEMEKDSAQHSHEDMLTANNPPTLVVTSTSDVIVETQTQSQNDDENGSDYGSLISHDPEDEDAEPDWLESD